MHALAQPPPGSADVDADGLVELLVSAIESPSAVDAGRPLLTAQWERTCQFEGELWDIYAAHGLASASLILVVVTQGVLDGFRQNVFVGRNSVLMGE